MNDEQEDTGRERHPLYVYTDRHICSDRQTKGHVARAMLRFQNYTDRPAFKSWLFFFLAVYPWAVYPAFMSLIFLVCKMG